MANGESGDARNVQGGNEGIEGCHDFRVVSGSVEVPEDQAGDLAKRGNPEQLGKKSVQSIGCLSHFFENEDASFQVWEERGSGQRTKHGKVHNEEFSLRCSGVAYLELFKTAGAIAVKEVVEGIPRGPV